MKIRRKPRAVAKKLACNVMWIGSVRPGAARGAVALRMKLFLDRVFAAVIALEGLDQRVTMAAVALHPDEAADLAAFRAGTLRQLERGNHHDK